MSQSRTPPAQTPSGTGAVFDTQVQPRFRDLNPGLHVDNVEALRIVDEARVHLLRFAAVGEQPAAEHQGLLGELPPGVGELMAGLQAEYREELRFAPHQPFLVRLWVSRIGRSSFELSVQLRTTAGQEPGLVARSTMVLFDHTAGGAWPMDAAVRGRLERYLGDPVELRHSS